jgi:hypothetical protein
MLIKYKKIYVLLNFLSDFLSLDLFFFEEIYSSINFFDRKTIKLYSKVKVNLLNL